MDREISSERLDLTNVSFAETNSLGAKEIIPRGKQSMRCAAMLVPSDDGDGGIVLDKRVRPPLLQIHHQIVVGSLAILVGRDIFVCHPLGQVMKDGFEVSDGR
jgi:hypothetical protein